MIREIGDALTGSGPMSEDCLRLNVWTPATGSGRRPVMVWFHGGGQGTVSNCPSRCPGRRPVMVWFHGGGQGTGSGNSILLRRRRTRAPL